LALATLVVAGCSSQPAPLPAVAPATQLMDFSGAWEIDYDLTENPQDKLRYLYEIAQSQYDQQQKARADRDGVRPASSRALNDLQGVIQLGTLVDAVTRSTILTINQDQDYIAIKRSGDYALTCDFLAPQLNLQIGVETCGLDAQGRLVFATRLPEGLTVVNRVSLTDYDGTADNKRLYVSTSMRSEVLGQSYSLNRVYRLFAPGEGLYECEFTLAKKKSCRLGSSASDVSVGSAVDE
jgi:hypothetical protein